MTHWKFCANASFFGQRRDRFSEYQPARTLEEKLQLIATVNGITGVELKYPMDFKDIPLARRLLDQHALKLAAVNVDIKDVTHFRHGALSARRPEARRKAISLLTEGMDLAAELGAPLVTTCPLADGHDYPFQVDHAAAWGNFIDSVSSVCAHRRDVTLLLEYQPHEPHAKVMLDTVGKMLHVCAEVGAKNLGANLDIGHSIAAHESPTEAAALLSRQGRLFYIHTNDNTGDGGDWDMVSGSVHWWHWIELLHTLMRIGYEGWLGGDISPKHMGPAECYDINTRMIQRMTALLDRAGAERIDALLAQEGAMARIYDLLTAELAN